MPGLLRFARNDEGRARHCERSEAIQLFGKALLSEVVVLVLLLSLKNWHCAPGFAQLTKAETQ